MFRRYGSWLLLLCAVALVCVPSVSQPAARLSGEVLPPAEFPADSHYIMGRDGMYLDLNLASVSELTDLPGVGAKLAERIVAHRKAHGDFASIEEIMDVEGIGEKIFSAIEPYIGVSD